jgi:hypothetical protein
MGRCEAVCIYVYIHTQTHTNTQTNLHTQAQTQLKETQQSLSRTQDDKSGLNEEVQTLVKALEEALAEKAQVQSRAQTSTHKQSQEHSKLEKTLSVVKQQREEEKRKLEDQVAQCKHAHADEVKKLTHAHKQERESLVKQREEDVEARTRELARITEELSASNDRCTRAEDLCKTLKMNHAEIAAKLATEEAIWREKTVEYTSKIQVLQHDLTRSEERGKKAEAELKAAALRVEEAQESERECKRVVEEAKIRGKELELARELSEKRYKGLSEDCEVLVSGLQEGQKDFGAIRAALAVGLCVCR